MKADLIIGNKQNNIAICTLWSERDKLCAKLDSSLFCIAGNLYSKAGVNHIIRTIFLNPNLRYLIVFGEDLSGSGEGLINFFEKGIINNKIIGTNTIIENEIPAEAINLLRSSVTVFDLRKKGIEELNQLLVELSSKQLPAFSQPMIFPESKKTVGKLDSEATGFVIRDKTIASAWLQILDLVLKFGVEKPSEYPAKQKELLNITAVIDEKDESIAEFFNFTDKELRQYLPTILTPFKPAKVSYTYGERMFKREDEINLSQVENAVEKLKNCPHTRRAVAFTWRIKDDAKSDNPPCLTHIMWIVQNNKLFQTVHFRSHELLEAWPMNLFALKELQELIANELDLEIGPFTCVSHSAHIYENKWDEASNVLEKHYKTTDTLELDVRGNFMINIENNKIVVTHLDKDGNITGYSFEGTEPKEIISQILHAHLISKLDHAAYLGRELQNAFLALKTGKAYIQDKD